MSRTVNAAKRHFLLLFVTFATVNKLAPNSYPFRIGANYGYGERVWSRQVLMSYASYKWAHLVMHHDTGISRCPSDRLFSYIEGVLNVLSSAQSIHCSSTIFLCDLFVLSKCCHIVSASTSDSDRT